MLRQAANSICNAHYDIASYAEKSTETNTVIREIFVSINFRTGDPLP